MRNVKALNNQGIQLSIFGNKEEKTIAPVVKKHSNRVVGELYFDEYAGTFQLNKKKSIHRWYPYIEGYSEDLVLSIIKEFADASTVIYDPFAGAGTTPLTASHTFLDSFISEINPFLRFVCDVKVNVVRRIAQRFKEKRNLLLKTKLSFGKLNDTKFDGFSHTQTISDCFSDKQYFDNKVLKKLAFLKGEILGIKEKDEDIGNLYLLALASVLVPVSRMKRATDLRYKTPKEIKKKDREIFRIFNQKIDTIYSDLEDIRNTSLLGKMFLLSGNAKMPLPDFYEKADIVITSPPYLNGTNYFRNSKLELWILDFIKNESEIGKLRRVSVPSGINFVTKERKDFIEFDIVEKTVQELETKAYDKRIPLMVRAYFSDIYKAFLNICKIMKKSGYVFVDIGDSIFSGVHIKTDEIFKELATKEIGFHLEETKVLRKRSSYNGKPLKECLIVLQKPRPTFKGKVVKIPESDDLKIKIKEFEELIPYRIHPYSKRNWGQRLHSLCSYQSKLKPAIAYFLIKYFTEVGQKIFDPFGGVGTIAFESCLNGRTGISNDINEIAHYNTLAKVQKVNSNDADKEIERLRDFIEKHLVLPEESASVNLNMNKDIKEYYHPDTFREILTARKFFLKNPPRNASHALVLSSLLHILHGNRPYALSRHSHGITPFAPRGPFIYKNLIEKLKEKVSRMLNISYPEDYSEGASYLSSIFEIPSEVEDIDVVITSPPFFGSTRFHTNNWIRLWFCGWEKEDFTKRKYEFLEVLQSKGMSIYRKVFEVLHQIMKKDGLCIMHLGVTPSIDMGKEMIKNAEGYFKYLDLIYEQVGKCEKHGIRDQGVTKRHQFLFLRRL